MTCKHIRAVHLSVVGKVAPKPVGRTCRCDAAISPEQAGRYCSDCIEARSRIYAELFSQEA